MATNFVSASYAVDEKKFKGWIHIIMKVKGLKVRKEGGLFKKTTVAKNANIENPTFGERTVLVQVEGKDDLVNKNIELKINRLPYDIIPDNCYIEPEEDRVVVWLKKADSGQSWKSFIEGDGIDLEED